MGQAWSYVAQAKKHGLSQAELTSLKQEVQAAGDTVHHIVRYTAVAPGHHTGKLSVTLVATFTSNPGSGRSQLAGGNPALFVLDKAREEIFSIDDVSKNQATRRVQTGDVYTLSGTAYRFNPPRQLTADGPTMYALDSKYDLVTYTSPNASSFPPLSNRW